MSWPGILIGVRAIHLLAECLVCGTVHSGRYDRDAWMKLDVVTCKECGRECDVALNSMYVETTSGRVSP